MSTTAALPPDFSNLLRRFRFDSAAQAEIEKMILSGIETLDRERIAPGSGVYQGTVSDLTDFLEAAQREASNAGKNAIDIASLAAARALILHLWPFF